MLQKAVIIGTGNVAWQLAHCLPLCGCCVLQIFGRNAHKAESLALEVGAEATEIFTPMPIFISMPLPTTLCRR